MICGYIPNNAHEELTLRPEFRSVGRSPKEDLKTGDVPLGVAVTPSSPLTRLKPLSPTHVSLSSSLEDLWLWCLSARGRGATGRVRPPVALLCWAGSVERWRWRGRPPTCVPPVVPRGSWRHQAPPYTPKIGSLQHKYTETRAHSHFL